MEDRRPYWKVAASLLVSLIGTVVFVVVGFQLMRYFMPFVIGWVIAMIANPVVRWLEKRLKIVRKLGSAIIIVMVLGLIVTGLYFGFSKAFTEIKIFIDNFPEMYQQFEEENSRGFFICCQQNCRWAGMRWSTIWIREWQI